MEPEDPRDLQRDLGRRVAELRVERGLTQESLAEKLAVTAVYVRRIEMGRENLTLRSLARIAAILSVRTADLFVAPQSREVRVGRPGGRSKAPITDKAIDAVDARPRAVTVSGGEVIVPPTEPHE